MQDTLIQGFQLSPQQRHLWSLVQHDHRFLATAQSAILLEGRLDVDRLRTALQRLVEQHEILHTTFRLIPGMPEPLQVIDDAEIAWQPEHDLRDLPDHAQIAAFDQLFDAAYRQPIDCEQTPVLHASLVTFADERHALLLRLPALCADRRTLTNLTLHLSRAYAALGTGAADDPEEALQYVVVSDWLNELLESEDAEPGKRYWRQQANLSAPIAKLPFERADGRTESAPYTPIRVTMDHEQLRAIEAAAQAHNTSVDAFLLTCWQVLLWRMLGSGDVVVGTSFDGRSDEDLAETLGLFTKYVPVSSQPHGELRFAELLQQLTDEIGDAAAWQECFDWDNFSSAGEQGLAFGFDIEPRAESHAGDDLIFTDYRQQVNVDQFQVKLACTHTGAGLEALLDYDPRLFARADIERMARSFVTLVDDAARHAQQPISQLELLDPEDRRQLLVAFNPQPADLPDATVECCLPELFAAQAARTPEQVALVLDDQELTYAELNRRANRLAHHLRSLGVGPEVFVALYLDRSIDMIVGLLAVLKAGGVYAPLDPDYPQERLKLIVDQLQPPVILTHQQLADKLPPGAGQVLCLDAATWPENDEPIVTTIQPHNLAYVIFTSGSTGQPKGVLVSHAAIAAHVLAARDHYGLTPDDRMLQFAVFHFDASLDQILPPLL
ncbi:MAG TPA: condensation domain-containing protein, partial [Herpetosiphonaceae bacterium]